MAEIIGTKLIVATMIGRVGATPQYLNEASPGIQVGESQASAAATYTSDPVDLGHGGVLALTLTTANIIGTLVTTVLTSSDNGATDTYRPALVADSAAATYAAAILGAFPAVTTNVATRRRFIVDRFVKFTHTITTGPVDITVTGQMRAS